MQHLQRLLSTHLELRAEPEVDDDVLVELAPDVECGEHHGVHQEGDAHEQRHDDAADPVERQHEEVVGGPTVKDSEHNAEFKICSLTQA